jgi:DUF4097 and DUF4098 domain-containing protein YvlB
MKYDAFCYLAAAALGAGWLLTPAPTARAARNYNLSINSNDADRCSDLRVSSNDGEVAQLNESVTLAPRDLSALELEDKAGRSIVRVRGWDRAEYTVETCKIAVADSKSAAETLARGISVSRSAGRLTTAGPTSNEGNWHVYFIVHAPKNAKLDLETKNGPISIEGIAGNTRVRAVNGPVSLKNCAGMVDAQTTNGPLSYTGAGGDVKLTAQNGPVSVELTGDSWNGPQLDAKTVNGPVSLSIPENYRSGVRLLTSNHAPLSCKIAACKSVVMDMTQPSSSRTLQLAGSADTVRVQTNNGPVSISGPRKRAI